MEWEVSYIKEKQLFEIMCNGNTGVIPLRDFVADPHQAAYYLSGMLNDLAVTK